MHIYNEHRLKRNRGKGKEWNFVCQGWVHEIKTEIKKIKKSKQGKVNLKCHTK